IADRTQPPVLQLPNIELPVRSGVFRPPQEYVACRLHDTLTLHHPLALVARVCRSQSLEHRRARFLQLQKQWRAVPAHIKPDGAERADAADANHFEGDVLELVPVNKQKSVGGQPFLVGVKYASCIERGMVEMINEWRPICDPRLPALDEAREVVVLGEMVAR